MEQLCFIAYGAIKIFTKQGHPAFVLSKKPQEALCCILNKGTIYQFTLDTRYSIFENIKKGDFQTEVVFFMLISKIHTQIKMAQFQNYNILLSLFSMYSSVRLIRDSYRLFYHFHLFQMC